MQDSKDKYGLIGAKLGHSFSKKYFTNKFDNQSINADYLNFELNDIDALKEVVKDPQLRGLNVTIPYKESVLQFLDRIDPIAAEVNAVNTIKIKDGLLTGFNTDVFGFKQMIKPFFKPHHEKALVLGTGGASKAVTYVLEGLGCEVNYISRSPSGEHQFSYSEINDLMMDFHKIIVNTTPVGMFPEVEELIDIPYKQLSTNHLVVDLIYNPLETRFLKEAKHHGAVTLNGLTMLEQQAEEAWRIWNE